MKKENINNESKNTVLEAILTEIETSGGSQESAIKSILRDHRLDAYMLVPEQSVKPCRDRYQVSRELIRIIRPAVYSTALAISASKGGKSKWTPWVLSAMMDIYAEWPTIFDWLNDTIKFSKSKDIRLESLVKTDEPGRKSPIEQDEERKRCNRLLLYLLRDPIYSYVTEGYIDSICESLSTWTIMRPTVDTIRSYQHLIKDVQLYTLSS